MRELRSHFALLVLLVTCGAIQAAEPIRYRFEPGEELRYVVTEKRWYHETLDESENTWRLWVVRAQSDGSRDLIVDVKASHDRNCLMRITLEPSGRFAWNSTLAGLPPYLSVHRILPTLPDDNVPGTIEWSETEARTQARWTYEAQLKDGLLSISGDCRTPLEPVSVGSSQFTWMFDPAKGRIISGAEKGSWEDYQEREEDTLLLAETIEHDHEWTAAFEADADRYFQTAAGFRAEITPHDLAVSVRAAIKDGGFEALQKKGRDLIEAGMQGCKDPLVLDYFAALLKEHEELASWRKEYFDFQKIIDKPSPQWTAMDIDGKEHSLADYAGKVVVLDVWFRKCNYCIRSQPQVDAVAEHFKNQPVQFLGINTDEDPDDARFAVAQLHPSYPTLLGKKLAKEVYDVQGAPYWFVIDRQGIVRAIHSGYSAMLEEELTKTIDELLK